MSTELEAQTSEEEGQIAFAIEQQVKRAKRKGQEALWELSEALYDFDECHGWLKLGYESLSEWLADPDITMTLGSYRRLVRTYRKLAVEKKIEPTRLRALEQSKVAIVTDAIASNRVLVDEALADVEAMGAKDLREKYYGRRVSNVGQPEPEPPEHPGQDEGVITSEAPPVVDEAVELVERWGFTSDQAIEHVQIEEASAVDLETGELLEAEVLDAYEFPGWVTPGAVEKMRSNFQEGVFSGANFPRLDRRDAQVAIELAKAWLATRPS